MKIKLEETANHRVAMLGALLKRQIFRIIAKNKVEITPDQWVILYYLWQTDGLSIGELAEKTNKDFANVTRIVNKLEQAGYVEKIKCSTDSRKLSVHVLPKAEGIKEKVQHCWQESMDIALKGISIDEQKKLIEIIDKMESNILESLENIH